MEVSHIPGAVTEPTRITVDTFDQAHGVTAQSTLFQSLAAQAYGLDYPAEVQPYGMTTWWTLGRCISGLRVGQDQSVVDLACGRGGPGLWLARATGARLTGVDWSGVAIEAARARAEAFLPPGRAQFMVGDLAASGLPNACADAVVCLDAIFFAVDRVAVLNEVRRVLRPAGRFVFTAGETEAAVKPSDVTDWSLLLSAAGLRTETKELVPKFAEQLGRMYELWLANLDAFRAEIGEAAAAEVEDEARTVGPQLAERRYLVVVARKPAESSS